MRSRSVGDTFLRISTKRDKLLPLVLTLFYVLPASGQTTEHIKKRTDLVDRELNGSVRTVKIETEVIETINTPDWSGGWIPSFLTFDRNGNLIEGVEYDDAGKIKEKIGAAIDPAGNKIKETHTDAHGNPLHTFVYTYDPEGNQIEYKGVYRDGSIMTWGKTSVDKHGNVISHTSLDGDGIPTCVTETSYNEKGKPTLESPNCLDEKLNGHVVHFYSDEDGTEKDETQDIDPQGNLRYLYEDLTYKNGDEAQFSYDQSGKILSKATTEYIKRDEHGNWTESIDSSWEDKDGKLILQSKKRNKRTITYY